MITGLRRSPKQISPKFFYDEIGSKLFDEITQLEEYYLTRTEMALFDRHFEEMAAALRDDHHEQSCLVEYGSGSSSKVRKLLQAMQPKAYVPVDISAAHLQDAARQLQLQLGRVHRHRLAPLIDRCLTEASRPDRLEY